MAARYALHKGSDGLQSVSVLDLVELYELKPFEWIIWEPDSPRRWKDYVHLYPQRDTTKYGRPDA